MKSRKGCCRLLLLLCGGLILGVLTGCSRYFDEQTYTTYFDPNFAPDGRIVAFKLVEVTAKDGPFSGIRNTVKVVYSIIIMNQDGSDEKEIVSGFQFKQAQVSPSMNYLAIHDNSQITVFRMNGETIRKLGPESGVTTFDWSPDEKYLAVIGGDYAIRIYDPFTGELIRKISKSIAYHLTWKYKEKIAFWNDTGNAFILPTDQGFVQTSENVLPLGYSKNENYLYSLKGGFYRIDLNSFQGYQTYEYLHDGKSIEAISPDGTKFLMSANTSGAGIYIKNADGTGLRELR